MMIENSETVSRNSPSNCKKEGLYKNMDQAELCEQTNFGARSLRQNR